MHIVKGPFFERGIQIVSSLRAILYFSQMAFSRALSNFGQILYSLPRITHALNVPTVLAEGPLSSFWILLELRVMEMVVTTGAIRRARLHNCVGAA